MFIFPFCYLTFSIVINALHRDKNLGNIGKTFLILFFIFNVD